LGGEVDSYAVYGDVRKLPLPSIAPTVFAGVITRDMYDLAWQCTVWRQRRGLDKRRQSCTDALAG
jgi:hypothetical protein